MEPWIYCRSTPLMLAFQGSAYCFLYPTIFARLSQRAKMLYMADENLYYLPEDYHADPSSLQITIATSRLPFVLDLPLGSKNGSKRRIDGRRYIVSYFQPQTLDTDGDEDMEGHCGFPGNVFGSVRMFFRHDEQMYVIAYDFYRRFFITIQSTLDFRWRAEPASTQPYGFQHCAILSD